MKYNTYLKGHMYLICNVYCFLQYIWCHQNWWLHGEHLDDQRPKAVSVRSEFLQWASQQVLGLCFCPQQSTWTRWVYGHHLKSTKHFKVVLNYLTTPISDFFWSTSNVGTVNICKTPLYRKKLVPVLDFIFCAMFAEMFVFI